MSRVFLATENRLNRKVVVKVLSPDLAPGLSAERFEQEIQLAGKLQQANIVPLLATGDTNGIPFFTMPYIEGESLRARLNKQQQIPIAECVGILRDVARALSYAHSAGVVHRDIKPDNVLLSHGAAMVTDFGIAKALVDARASGAQQSLTQTGTSIGSPGYMSPEQVAGDPNVDHRADLYAFGCLGYELLTGHPPFIAGTPQKVLAAHITERPKPVSSVRMDVPRGLESAVMHCLAKDPSDRPATADDVLLALGNTGESATTRRVSKFRWMAVAAGIAVVLAGAAYAKLGKSSSATAARDKSIAVLPLANLSGDKSNDFFGEGLAEEITATLAKAGMHVVGRSSARALTAKGVSPVEIAKQFHVANILEGSVQRSGEQIRIAVSLVSMQDESVLWSERYDRSMKDVFAVQDEIAHAVASQLKVKLTGAAALTETTDADAHTDYLQGIYLWNRRTVAGLHTAIGLFADAIRRDPNYAQAYAGMALAYVVLPAYDDDAAPEDALTRAVDAANRALALDSVNVPALTALAYATGLQYRNREAERLYQRAIAIDSSFATTHFWHALLLMQQERNDEALVEMTRARALEPASLVINTGMVQVLYDKRRYDEAAKAGEGVMRLDPAFQLGIIDYAKVLIEQGQTRKAIDMVMPTLGTPGVSFREKVGVAAYALARAGRRDEASLVLQKIQNASAVGSERGMVAAALDAIGRRDDAVRVLEEAVKDHDLWLAHYIPSAPYDGLRHEPKARQLFAKVSAR
jgi:serine/threonine-protein kinase